MSLIGRTIRDRLLTIGSELVDGCLHVRLPDGSEHRLGPADHPRRAGIEVVSDRLWGRLVRNPRMAVGDTFVEGLWHSDDPATVLEVLARVVERRRIERGRMPYGWRRFRPHWPRRNHPVRARRCIQAHYDLGNDLFAAFLDPTMTYSSAVFEHPGQSLEDAQLAKYERICRKLDLRPGMRVLEIGCGWGGFAIHAARTHGVHVTGVTLSEQQHALGTERVAEAGLAEQVDLRLVDYRTLSGTWDRIVSIEMFEAIGEREFDRYFTALDQLLAPGGSACVQTIAVPERRWQGYRRTEDWIQRRIFPGGLLPAIEPMLAAMRRAGELHLHDLEEIGIHYADTLRQWRMRFLAAAGELDAAGYDTRFRRTWEYYLAFCEAGFRARILRDVQLVFTRAGNDELAPVRPC
jgi:cyclopropane-fatty-acyl-phospholipid synthase